jgi:ABC-type antimicrobial peptide transport system permease subunit
MTAVGLLLGLATAVVLAPRANDLLYATSPHDPLTLGSVAALLLAVGLLASGLPAWRAARVDPHVALRAD